MKNLTYLPLMFLLAPTAFAQDLAMANPNLYDLSIEQLLQIDVSAGTNVKKSYSESPASLYVYTKQMLEEMDYYTISDLAEITPGYSSYLGFGERTLVSRGQKASGFDNNHHLVLIDGIKVNHSRNDRVLMEEELSLFGASQVEFLNGPASALYGTGAFSGVVNIVSEQAKSGKLLSKQRAGIGSNNTLNAYSLYSRNNDIGLFNLQFSYFQRDSENKDVGTKTTGWQNQDDRKSTYLNLSYKLKTSAAKGLALGAIVMNRNSGMGPGFFGSSAGYHESNELIWNTTVTYLKYDKEFSDNKRLESKITSNRSREKSYFSVTSLDEFRNYDITTQLYSFQSDFINEFSENTSLLVGVQFDTRWREGQPDSYEYIGSPSNFSNKFFKSDSDKLNNQSAYAQYSLKKKIFFPTDFTIGLRSDTVDSPASNFNQLSPRIAAVASVTPNLKLKFLHSKALKAPNLKNILLNQQAIEENKDASVAFDDIPDDLVAEKIENNEIGVVYFTGNYGLSASVFRNFRTDSIGGATLNGKSVSVNNKGVTEAHGAEIQVKYQNDDLKAFVNSSWAHSNTPNNNHFSDVPEMTTNIGLMLTPPQSSWCYGMVVKNTSKFKTSDGQDQPSGFFLVDFNIEYKADRDYTYDLKIKNLTDANEFHPFNGEEADPLPGRSIILSLNII